MTHGKLCKEGCGVTHEVVEALTVERWESSWPDYWLRERTVLWRSAVVTCPVHLRRIYAARRARIPRKEDTT